MLNFETLLIVMACSVPAVALLLVLPKLKKKEKKQAEKIEAKPVKQDDVKEIKEETIEESPREKQFNPVFNNTEFSTEDFKGYLKHRQNNMTRPERVDLPEGFIDRTMPYVPRRRKKEQEKPQTVAEEIKSLSPELKALIFSGALDKKNFD